MMQPFNGHAHVLYKKLVGILEPALRPDRSIWANTNYQSLFDHNRLFQDTVEKKHIESFYSKGTPNPLAYTQAKQELFYKQFLPTRSQEAQRLINQESALVMQLLRKTPEDVHPITIKKLESLIKKLNKTTSDVAIDVLHALLVAYHPDTGLNHCLKMATEMAPLIVESYGDRPDRPDLELVQQACLIHDIGKLFVTLERVLDNPKKLTHLTEREMHKHPDEGATLLKKISPINPILIDVTEKHHRYADGSGYGGKETKITELIQKITIGDIINALKEPRSYKDAASWPVITKKMADLLLEGKITDNKTIGIMLKKLKKIGYK